MGLYIRLAKPRNDIVMLKLFETVIKQLEKYFEFQPTSKYRLWLGFPDDDLIEENEKPESSKFIEIIKEKSPIYKEKFKRVPHFSINVEGIITVYEKKSNVEKGMVIDVEGSCTDLNKLYGNVWIDFYDNFKEWERYFSGEDGNQQNRKRILNLIKDLTMPAHDIHSIVFASSNDALELYNNAFYVYFRQFKYFISEIFDIVRDRLNDKNLEPEGFYLSKENKKKLMKIKEDLKIYAKEPLIELLDRKGIGFNNNFGKFVKKNYSNETIYATTASIEIKDVKMRPEKILSVLIDFIVNFIRSMDNTIMPYDELEKRIEINFGKHEFYHETEKSYQAKLGIYKSP
ncbi:MAG: hypothetical protein ACTSRA_11160 [Promethearchaeota archaeon]